MIHNIQSDNNTWIYLKISRCPSFFSSAGMKDYTPCIRDNTGLSASCLCVAWRHFAVRWVGRGGPNERPAISVFVLWWSMKKPTGKSKKTLWTGTKSSTNLCPSSRIHKEKCWVCLFQVAEICAKCWGQCRNLLPYSSVSAVKWSSKWNTILLTLAVLYSI